MALRYLQMRMRTPAAAALRQAAAHLRVSPAARSRSFFTKQQAERQVKRIFNLESASVEEIRRETRRIKKEIGRAREHWWKNIERGPAIEKEAHRTGMIVAGYMFVTQIFLWVYPEPDYSPVEPEESYTPVEPEG